MQTEKFFQIMKDKTEIAVNRWIPDDEENIKAVVVLSHGMLEHSLRYDRLGSILSEQGYVFNAHDHRGHGKTAANAEQKNSGIFGKLADKNGFSIVTEDLAEVISEVKKDYPNKKIILLGHSFGSFVAQNYIENYGNEINGCILCGSAGPQKSLGIKKLITSLAVVIHGANYRSKFIQKQAFSGYNKRIKDAQTGFEWLSVNKINRDMYANDSWCGGVATVSFFRDLTKGFSIIHSEKNINKIPKNLPIYAITGSEDPVGDYARSVEKLLSLYKKAGIENVSLKIYDGDRHELFNEDDSETVISDMISWIASL